MSSTVVAGIDPGLIHTGLVVLEFSEDCHDLTTGYAVIDGLDPAQTRVELEELAPRRLSTIDVFIEKYVPRSGFATNDQMTWANTSFTAVLGGKLLRNMGVVQIVTRDLLKLLGLWTFPQTTHHDDLRSAARIALLGMMRDSRLNEVLYTYVTHRLDTTP